MERNFKRFLTVGDLHCGHRVGLTPPEFDYAVEDDRYYRVRRELWNAYADAVDAIQPIDIMLVNGDCCDGKGQKSGATELIRTDMNSQVAMAQSCILYAKPKKIVMTYGTGYHVSPGGEDWEKVLADRLTAQLGYEVTIGAHEWYDINGTVFDCKHKVGSSSVPYGRGTPISKDRFWNLVWAEFDEQPKADVLIRSHTHAAKVDGEPGTYMAYILPALQGQGSKFGGRVCQGTVHFGIMWFDCYEGGGYRPNWKIIRVLSQRREAVKL